MKVPPAVIASVWPTILVIATGAFGMSGRLLTLFSVLLNAALFWRDGLAMGLISLRHRKSKLLSLGSSS